MENKVERDLAKLRMAGIIPIEYNSWCILYKINGRAVIRNSYLGKTIYQPKDTEFYGYELREHFVSYFLGKPNKIDVEHLYVRESTDEVLSRYNLGWCRSEILAGQNSTNKILRVTTDAKKDDESVIINYKGELLKVKNGITAGLDIANILFDRNTGNYEFYSVESKQKIFEINPDFKDSNGRTMHKIVLSVYEVNNNTWTIIS